MRASVLPGVPAGAQGDSIQRSSARAGDEGEPDRAITTLTGRDESVPEVGKTISVRELLHLVPHLGIPHFQRGRVWGKDGISALLESLFYDTPCGGFVLWNSGNNGAHGVRLDPKGATNVTYLVIDGQQRIRSLRDAYADAELDVADEAVETSSGGEPAKTDRQWCINLAKAPGFADLVEVRGREFSLFVYTADPRHANARSPLRANVLPLAAVRNAESWAELAHFHKFVDFRKEVAAEEGGRRASEEYGDLRRAVLAIDTREFFVTTRDPTSNLAEMADLYNRINASGKQVEIEERAFARLVGLQAKNDDMVQGLRSTFVAIHGLDKKSVDHDALLRREGERAFGFKLFIRVFLQVCQHHFGYRQGKSTFSFDVLERDDFRQAFSVRSPPEVGQLWAETRRVLCALRSVLSDELHCDDLRFLPDATSLMPVLQLLIQYRDLGEDRYRPLLGLLCLRTALGDADSRTLSRWIAIAGDPNKLAFEIVPGLMKAATERAARQLDSALEEANSVQSRYVLLLYWLQRRLRAKDFRYELIVDARTTLTPPELVLQADADPQKQHLVPFSVAARIFGPDARRTGSHLVHNIGNLTYISALENGLDVLGDNFADLAGEVKLERNNAVAHFLVSLDVKPLEDYAWIQQRSAGLDDEVGLSALRNRFVQWTARRREIIRFHFGTWLEELESTCLRSLGVDSWHDVERQAKTHLRIEPIVALFPVEMQPAALVRTFGFGALAEDRLIALLAKTKVEVKEGKLHMGLTKNRIVWVEVGKDGINLCVRLPPGELRAGVFSAVVVADSGSKRCALPAVPDLIPLLNYCTSNADALRTSKSTKCPGPQTPTSPGELGYPQSVVLALNQLGGAIERPAGEASLSIRWKQREANGSVRQILRLDLFQGGQKLSLRMRDPLGGDFVDAFTGTLTSTSKGLARCTVTGPEATLRAVEWLAGRLPGSGSSATGPKRANQEGPILR